jgi:hypothetical protein
MAAEDHLSEQQFMYHHSAAENRSSIREHGLLASSPFNSELHEDEGMAPTGVYMGVHRENHDQTEYGRDLWKVNTAGLDTRPDPDDPNGEWGFHYTPHDVSPDRVSLARKSQRRMYT